MKNIISYIATIVLIGTNAICANKQTVPVLPDNFNQIVQEADKYQSGDSMESLRQIEALISKCKNNPQLRNEMETALETILNSNSTVEAKKFACQQLAIIGPVSSLNTLGRLSSVEITSGFACMAIVNSPSAEATAVLCAAYPEANLTAKIQIINAIGNRRDASAIPFLKQQLSDGQIVGFVLTALGKIGTKTATETIFEFKKQCQPSYINPVDDSLLLCAEKALIEQRRLDASSIYKEIFNDSVPAHIKRAAFLGLVKTDNDGGAGRIEATLTSADATLKAVAISLIPTIKGANISSRFSKLMTSLQPSEQALLIDALARRGDKDAIKTIEQLVDSQNNEVKYAAITALGNIGNVKHVKILVKALTEATNPQELRIVEQAISSLKGGKTIDLAIVSELKNASSTGKTRIINVLGRRYATVAVDAILVEAVSADTATSRAAFKVLARLSSEKNLPQLVDALIQVKSPEAKADAESAVAAIIEKTQDKQACENLICERLEKATDTETRVSLINLLPVCGGRKALEMAKSAYSSADSTIKEAGIRAISEWQDISVWETLINIYTNPPSESYRVLALRGLTRLLSEENIRPDANLVSKYQQLFNGAKNINDKKLILGAMSGCNHPEALYLALEKINEPEIKLEAVAAVKKIATAIQQRYPREAAEALQKIK